MAELITTSNTKFYISTTTNNSAADEAAYEALSYTEVKPIEGFGAYGETVTPVNFTALNDSFTQVLKGTNEPVSFDLTCGFDPDDTGQAALRVARGSQRQYAFKITYDDEGAGSPSNPTTHYFRGLVMGEMKSESSANAVRKVSYMISQNSLLVEVDAV